jgi:hypothetical protein
MARAIQRIVTAGPGRSFFAVAVIAIVAAGAAGAVYVLAFRFKIRSAANYLWLAAIGAAYVILTIQRWRAPEEAVHFLEYGLLGFFLFRAFHQTVRDWTVYLDAVLAGSLIGIVDEIIQWAVPGRTWDFRDAGFNVMAGILFQLAVWKGIRPKAIPGRASPRSLRRASILLAANLVLLGLCMSNTPKRVLWYTEKIPALGFLRGQEMMHDFDMKKYADPAIGTYYSRLGLGDVVRIDASRWGEYGDILRNWSDKPYDDFLAAHSSTTSPFLHEMRVRIFRRDRRLERGSPEDIFVAYKENLILEKRFPMTLDRSGYRWTNAKKEEIASRIDARAPYASPLAAAGGGFLTAMSEPFVWGFILVTLAGLALLNVHPKPSR